MPLETRRATAADNLLIGPSAYDAPIEKKTFGEEFAAGFDRENSVTAWHQDAKHRVEAEEQEAYDQFRDIPDDLLGMPSEMWRGVTSPAMMQARISDIRAELVDREQRSVEGWGGTLGEITGYMLSPETIGALAIALPTGGSSVVGRAAMGAGVLAAAEAPHEYAMHESQALRTAQETATNIAASAIMGGVIVGAFGKRLTNSVSKGIHSDIENAITNNGVISDSTAGAAQVTGYNPQGEVIKNPPWIKSEWLSPARPIAASSSDTSRGVLAQFWENSFAFGKNADGTSSTVALETRANQTIGQLTRVSNETVNSGYKKFVGAKGRMDLLSGAVKNRGQRSAFEREVHWAMSNGDTVPAGRLTDPAQIKAVEDTAKGLRSNIYDKTLKMAQDSGLMADPEDFAVRFADSYVPRRWNKKQIRTDKAKFTAALRERYEQDAIRSQFEQAQEIAREEAISRAAEGLSAKELAKIGDEAAARLPLEAFDVIDPQKGLRLDELVEDSYQRIVNNFDMDVYTGAGTSAIGSPFKGRELPLDDSFLLKNDWLHSDMELMTRNHINRVVKPSMMALEAGDPEMKAPRAAIRQDYQNLIDAAKEAGDTKLSAKLSDQLKTEMDMHAVILDRWYGRRNLPKTKAGAIVHDVFRGFRSLNTSLMMGMVLPTSAGDAARWNLATIYAPELGEAGPTLINAFESMKLNKEQWAKIGIAHEAATRIRQMKLYDGNDVIHNTGAHAITDLWTEGTAAASSGLMRATHLAEWTDFGKNMAAAYSQNDMLQKLMRWDDLTSKTKEKMARLGFDEKMSKAVKAEVERSKALAPDEAGIRIHPNKTTEVNWDNWKGADAEKFGTILFRESERAIVTPTVIDMPLFFGDSELGKTMAQFMSFAMAAHNQVMIPLGRRFREGDLKAYSIMGQLLSGGLVAYGVREMLYGDRGKKKRTAMDYALNAVDYSGAVPLLMMGFNGVNMLSQNQLTDAIGATSMSRTSNRPLMSVLGPTAGTMENMYKTGQAFLGRGPMTEADWNRAKRITPWNNLMYFNAAGRIKEMTE